MRSLALNAFEQDGGEDWKGLAQGETDYCSRDGAVALKSKIEAYWRERGQNVMIVLSNVGFHPAIRAARYDVRSDMVNGRPRASAAASASASEAFLEDYDTANDDISFD